MSSDNSQTSSPSGLESDGSSDSASVTAAPTPTSSAESSTATIPPPQGSCPGSGVSAAASSLLQPASLDQLEISLPDDTRECYTCRRTLPSECFSTHNSNGANFKNRRCNQCRRKREEGSPLAQRKRAIWETARGKPCADCSRTFPLCCMDFDHVRGEKLYVIGSAWRWISVEALEQETAKCDVVCACCHRIRTSGRPHQNPGRKPKFLAESERKSVRSRPSSVALELSRTGA